MAEPSRFSIDAMVAFTRDALIACGVPAADAGIAADKMIEADRTGFDAHGIFRIGMYCQTLRSGRVNPKANIRVLQRSPGTALVDGDDGIGHLVMTYCADLAVELARESGIGWVGARNSNHGGAAGIYAEMPTKHDMVGIYSAVSTINNMGPWGGGEALIGTNPIAFGIPAGSEPPVVLDIATSIASFGNIRRHAAQGKPIPEGWVVHSDTGEPITDPNKATEGVLLPIGGHKGAGLALIIGLLGGVLNGAAFGREVVDMVGPGNQPTNTGQFMVAIDVKRFLPIDVFKAEVDRQLADLRGSKRLPGVDAIRIPGEDRARRRMERVKNGVALPPQLLKQLDALAADLKIAPLAAR
jgi:LDH2 family malate/lactate/ureidoglycolate dehydrogenase